MTEKARSALPAKLWPWHKHVCACQASGQTMVAYAKAHRLSVQAFYRAKARFHLPVYLDEAVMGSLSAIAERKGVPVDDLVNDLLKKELAIAEVLR